MKRSSPMKQRPHTATREGAQGQAVAHPHLCALLRYGCLVALVATSSLAAAQSYPAKPIRIVVPWKYGFKGIKSIVRISFTEREPRTSWSAAAPHEYGFYANVNPAVDHPRWSQKRERRLPGFFANHDTEPFNGYGEQVASLYAGMDLAKFY